MAKRKKQKQHWTPLYRTELNKMSPEQEKDWVDKVGAQYGGRVTREEALKELRLNDTLEVWKNDIYLVLVARNNEEYNGWVHLSFRRNDREPVTDWRHKQLIKNQLVGEECEAAELFPAESRLGDTANQFHLWCWPEESERFPFGWDHRAVSDVAIEGHTTQRKLDK